MKKRKLIALTLAAVTVLTMLAGCGNSGNENSVSENSSGSSKASSETKKDNSVSDEDTITIALADDLSVVDPIHGYSTEPDAILMQIAEGLFYFDSDNSIQPLIAKSYTQPDLTTYIYEIRDDVTFSDGNKLTADDVVFSLERHRDTSDPSELAWMFDSVDTIQKTGDNEVTVKLKTPDPMWQDSLATSAGLVIEKSYFEEHKEDFGKPSGGIVGSGPYVISDWKQGEQLDLVANENYWNKDTKVDFKKLVFKAIDDPSVTKLSLESGQVDVALRLPVESAQELEGYDNIDVQAVDMFACHFLSFNTSRKPFDDVNLRKAVAYAIDKKTLAESIFGEKYGAPAESLPFGRSLIGYNDDEWNKFYDELEKYPYDLDKAKEYLAKSSVPNGTDVKIVYKSTDSVIESAVLVIQQNLAKININVTIEGLTPAEISTLRYGGSETRDYDLMLTLWATDYPDPIGVILPLFYSENNVAGGSNWVEYKNDKFDELMKKQAQAADSKERDKVLREALSILADEIPSVPVYHSYLIAAKNKRIDYTFSSMILYNVHFKDFKKAG